MSIVDEIDVKVLLLDSLVII